MLPSFSPNGAEVLFERNGVITCKSTTDSTSEEFSVSEILSGRSVSVDAFLQILPRVYVVAYTSNPEGPNQEHRLAVIHDRQLHREKLFTEQIIHLAGNSRYLAVVHKSKIAVWEFKLTDYELEPKIIFSVVEPLFTKTNVIVSSLREISPTDSSCTIAFPHQKQSGSIFHQTLSTSFFNAIPSHLTVSVPLVRANVDTSNLVNYTNTVEIHISETGAISSNPNPEPNQSGTPITDPKLLPQTYQMHQHEIQLLSFSPDGAYIASASTQGTRINVLDVKSNSLYYICSRSRSGKLSTLTSLAFSRNNQFLCAVGSTPTLHIFSLETQRKAPFFRNMFVYGKNVQAKIMGSPTVDASSNLDSVAKITVDVTPPTQYVLSFHVDQLLVLSSAGDLTKYKINVGESVSAVISSPKTNLFH
ncbi:hypothetical protein BLNAU_19457 [Blattamonas nauphoetae]|uniref:Uncharacterized protein n=1 Tax=Blattamonas nauphoetae TaxID=2049346 RepID=A0ABQ9X1E3_9EUKA|nr:hypothetical protein BLNAU_19457 [Blattamonas nauphoetae]